VFHRRLRRLVHCSPHGSRWPHHHCPRRHRLRRRRPRCVLRARVYAARRATARSRPATLRSTVRLSIDPAWGVS
jgi:hypothetical protein